MNGPCRWNHPYQIRRRPRLHGAGDVVDQSRSSSLQAKRAVIEVVSPQDLPFHVLDLLQHRIFGVEELEALLLVRSDATARWTASAVAARLERPESWSSPALEGLCAAELLVGEGPEERRRYAYRPATPELDASVTLLASLYEERRVDVLRVLNDKAVERIRIAAAKTFSAALEDKRKRGRKRNGRKRLTTKPNGESEGGT